MSSGLAYFSQYSENWTSKKTSVCWQVIVSEDWRCQHTKHTTKKIWEHIKLVWLETSLSNKQVFQVVWNLKTHSQDTHNSSDHSLRETFEPENYKTSVLQQAAPTPTTPDSLMWVIQLQIQTKHWLQTLMHICSQTFLAKISNFNAVFFNRLYLISGVRATQSGVLHVISHSHSSTQLGVRPTQLLVPQTHLEHLPNSLSTMAWYWTDTGPLYKKWTIEMKSQLIHFIHTYFSGWIMSRCPTF